MLINFEVNPYEEYRIGVPRPGIYEEAFNSDDEAYGGSGVTNKGAKFVSENTPWNGQKQSIVMRVPPLGGTVLRYVGPLPKPKKTAAVKEKVTAAKKDAEAKVAAVKKGVEEKAAELDAEAAALKAKRSAAAKKAAATRRANAAKKAAEKAAQAEK